MPTLAFDGTFDGWRAAARTALGDGLAPDAVVWHSADDVQHGLALGGADADARPAAAAAWQGTVPRRFLAIGALVACHRDPDRWATLYRVLWRLTRGGEPHLLAVAVDPDMLHLTRMAKAIRREVHKLHAFVRFRLVQGADGVDEYIAWFEPEHDVVEQAAALFVRRFANMRWAVLTPRRAVRWDGSALRVGPGVPRHEAPSGDVLERLWGTYYAHIFNPARVKLDAMRAEMPKRYWRNLPEAPLIGPMVRDAPGRVRRMVEAATRPARNVGDAKIDVAASRGSGGRIDVRRDGSHAIAPARIGDALVYHGSAEWERDTGERDGAAVDAAERLRRYAERFPLAVAESTRQRVFAPALARLWVRYAPAGLLFDVYAHEAMVGGGLHPHRLPRAIRDLLPRSLVGAERVAGEQVPSAVSDALWERFLAAAAVLAEHGTLGAVILGTPRGFGPSRDGAGRVVEWLARLRGYDVGVEFGDPAWTAGRLRARTMALVEREGGTVVVGDGEERGNGELAIVRGRADGGRGRVHVLA